VAQAVTFIPLSFEQQVSESYGVIKGSYITSVSKKLPSGEVVTESVFKVSEFSGIKITKLLIKITSRFFTLVENGRGFFIMLMDHQLLSQEKRLFFC